MNNLENFNTKTTNETAREVKGANGVFDKTSWAEQKKAEKDQSYLTIDKAAEHVSKDGLMLKTYLDLQARFDRYSVANVLLILAQKPDATKLADFNSWKEHDVFVKKGETGIIILEPGDEYKREDGTVGVSYNTKKVFDISQTNSQTINSPAVKKDERIILKALITNSPVAINVCDQLPAHTNALYKPETKEILIRNGVEGVDAFIALSKELAHVEMDKTGYDRNEIDFSAFCTSYIVSKRCGIDVSTFSFDQLPNKFQNMPAIETRTELSKIRDAANAISSRMAKVLEPPKNQNIHKDDQSR